MTVVTKDVSGILPDDCGPEVVANVSAAALDILTSKGCDVKTVRYYSAALPESSLYFDYCRSQSMHFWFADVIQR